MNIRILGPFHASFRDRVLSFRSEKIRALFAYLALHEGQSITREKLFTLLWKGSPVKQGKNNLRVSISRLRKALKPIEDGLGMDILHVDRQALRLELSSAGFAVDVHTIDALMRECSEYPTDEWYRRSTCIENLQKVMEQYGGAFLEGFTVEDAPDFELWKHSTAEKYHKQILSALVSLSEHFLAIQMHEKAKGHARRILKLEPWNEEAHRLLMRSFLIVGDKRAAQQQFELCKEQLREELGVEPEPATQALYQQCTSQMFSGEAALIKGSLPRETTAFIGRTRELEEILPRLFDRDCPLVSIVGVGGVGKSRLAQEAARRMQTHFADGVWFVRLEEDPELSDEAGKEAVVFDRLCVYIAKVMSFRFFGSGSLATQLSSFLSGKDALIVLDSFEHFTHVTKLLVDFLHKHTKLKILITSRKSVEGDFWTCQLGGLLSARLPHSERPTAQYWQKYDSLVLFEERLKHNGYTGDLGTDEREKALNICQSVDGSPLAIEIAAALIQEYSLEDIANSVQQSPDLLQTPLKDMDVRHRSIRLILNDVWQSLDDEKQAFLAKLSVFRGDFDAQAMSQITGSSSKWLAFFTKQLLLKEPSKGRYLLHDLLRTFLQENLQKQTQVYQETKEQHTRYYLDLLKEHTAELKGEKGPEHYQACILELENIRTAWYDLLERKHTSMIKAYAYPLSSFLRTGGLLQEGVTIFASALEVFTLHFQGEESEGWDTLSLLADNCSLFRSLTGQFSEALEFSEKSLAWGNQAEDKNLMAHALFSRGRALFYMGTTSEAEASFEQSLALLDTEKFPELHIHLLHQMGWLYWTRGNIAEGKLLAAEAVELCQKCGDLLLESQVLSLQAYYFALEGSFVKSRLSLQAGMEKAQQQGSLSLSGRLSFDLGLLLNQTGFYDESYRLLAKAKKNFKYHGASSLSSAVLLGEARHFACLGHWEESIERYNKLCDMFRQEKNIKQLCHALLNLSALYIQKGEPTKADKIDQEAFEIAQKMNNHYYQRMAYAHFGKKNFLLGNLEKAKHYFGLAMEGFKEAGMNNFAMENLGGLAMVALKTGSLEVAKAHVEDILSYLEEHTIESDTEPQRAYLYCYYVLQALQDSRAKELLKRTHQRYTQRLKNITAPDDKASFKRIPVHQELLTLYKNMAR